MFRKAFGKTPVEYRDNNNNTVQLQEIFKNLFGGEEGGYDANTQKCPHPLKHKTCQKPPSFLTATGNYENVNQGPL